MVDNVPEGFYRGRNGRIYRAKRESVLQRIAREAAERAAIEAKAGDVGPEQAKAELEGYNANYSTYRGQFNWPDSFEVIEAPTTDSTGYKMRALECGYHYPSETLVIVFRAPVKAIKGFKGKYDVKRDSRGIPLPPPICMYPDVPKEMWENLKTSDSTGKFLKYSGIDQIDYSMITMPALREQFK
jgi:hypothetical protein